jgi:hypothetical protein
MITGTGAAKSAAMRKWRDTIKNNFMTVKQTILPPEDEAFLLKAMTLKLRVDYRIAGRIEDELKKIFVCEELRGGGLNILAYRSDEKAEKIIIQASNPDNRE